jgi:hypothetical protein
VGWPGELLTIHQLKEGPGEHAGGDMGNEYIAATEYVAWHLQETTRYFAYHETLNGIICLLLEIHSSPVRV